LAWYSARSARASQSSTLPPRGGGNADAHAELHARGGLPRGLEQVQAHPLGHMHRIHGRAVVQQHDELIAA
jgi:hypothetical protein